MDKRLSGLKAVQTLTTPFRCDAVGPLEMSGPRVFYKTLAKQDR